CNNLWKKEEKMEGEENASHHIPLIQRVDEGVIEDKEVIGEGSLSKAEIFDEAKRQLYLAGPLIAVTILQFLVQVISVMFVGHLGKLPLSSASLATSFASVTGFYVLDILIFCHQDHEIAEGAGTFNQWMIPSLFAYGLLQCLTRFFQTQNIVLPMMLTSGVTAVLHVLVCWVLIFKLELGIKGAALANNVSYWINFFLLAIYVKFSPAWMTTWTGFSKEAFHDLWNFLKLAVPSALMICLEYWSFEMVVLLAGLLEKPKLETSVLSISLNTCWMVYMVSVGLGSALSTRVSNELGAGRPRAARLALFVMVIISVIVGLVVATTTISVRYTWGRLYSNDEEVVRYVAKMMLLLAISDFLDGFQCVLSGAARGCGWQTMCSIINLGAYYFVALPCAVFFAFILHMGGMGLWMGIICGLLVQVIVLVTINLFTDWNKEGSRALART
ncbi:hypothetical protein SOVF_153750, partial [Spinacia oleracea]